MRSATLSTHRDLMRVSLTLSCLSTRPVKQIAPCPLPAQTRTLPVRCRRGMLLPPPSVSDRPIAGKVAGPWMHPLPWLAVQCCPMPPPWPGFPLAQAQVALLTHATLLCPARPGYTALQGCTGLPSKLVPLAPARSATCSRMGTLRLKGCELCGEMWTKSWLRRGRRAAHALARGTLSR